MVGITTRTAPLAESQDCELVMSYRSNIFKYREAEDIESDEDDDRVEI